MVWSSGGSAGQTADGAVTGSAARTDYRCSLNKAFIARMCVHDPEESRVTVVRATCECPCDTACCFNYIMSERMQHVQKTSQCIVFRLLCCLSSMPKNTCFQGRVSVFGSLRAEICS